MPRHIFWGVGSTGDSEPALRSEGALLLGVHECFTYRSKLKSVPDLKHNIVYQAHREEGFYIEDVKSTEFERSYYWCELDITKKDGGHKKYRHFGFNTTHWWVEKGCGGWFLVTECRLLPENPASTDKLNSSSSGNRSAATDLGYSLLVDPPSTTESLQLDDPDDPYKKWPRIGYMSPHSDVMWDLLDRATYVDVPEQMAYHDPSVECIAVVQLSVSRSFS
ncbi:Aragonite protein ap24 [Plakobranchus ocellatus]|uniref:Aragonite protein ap24 n=1 Tax=Plakobranchus ocellatus TaxID=259542 RepID=A0AAV4BR19_9GAST|nr:Aragonite protein ap24 [Plakobranchus ocellatus]